MTDVRIFNWILRGLIVAGACWLVVALSVLWHLVTR